MPTKHVIAMLMATKPADAARILQSVPEDRVALLMTEMEPAYIASLLLAVGPDRKAELYKTIPVARTPLILRHLSVRQLADLLSVLPDQVASESLGEVPPHTAAEILSGFPAAVRSRLLEPMAEHHRDQVLLEMYHRRAEESVARIATSVSWLDRKACDLLALVLGRRFHVAVRYRPHPTFAGAEVDSVVSGANWQDIAGLVVLTNVALAASATGRADTFRLSGRPLEVLRWLDERDDGVLKRALARLAG